MKKAPAVSSFYQIIGVDENADETVIKKAYRHLVLKWHPDKNPEDKARAEEQIRLINTAYATLSNPAKRERYDLQRGAMDKQKRGVVPTPRTTARMDIPKQFMMQPMGHVDRFIRCQDKKVSVQARSEVKVSFDDFFRQTKLALWWVPDVNNKCRIRNLGSKAKGDKKAAMTGLAGGLNFSFRTKKGYESEVMLTAAQKGQKAETVDFVAKPSPELEGAYRFETACRRGYYLAFFPPTDLRVAPLLNEAPSRVLDFVLVDFSEAIKFKDIDEVLLPVGSEEAGSWVHVTKFQENEEVKTYFDKVLKRKLWDIEDFAAYFEGHWVDWDYSNDKQSARLRGAEERLGQVLNCAAGQADALQAVGKAGDELKKMPLEGALRAVHLLTEETEEDVTADQVATNRKLLKALRDILSGAPREALMEMTVAELLDVAEKVPALTGPDATPDVLADRADAIKLLTQMLISKVTPDEQPEEGAPPKQEMTAADVARALRLPGLSSAEEELFAKVLGPSMLSAPRKDLVQAVRNAVARECFDLARSLTEKALPALETSTHDEALKALAELVAAGSPADLIGAVMAERAKDASVKALAAAVCALCNSTSATHKAAKEVLSSTAEALAAKAPLTSLPTETLLSLAVTVAKVPAVGPVLCKVLEALLPHLPSLPMEDFVRLLLAAGKGRAHLPQEARDALMGAADAAFLSKLEEIPAQDVVKLTLAMSGHSGSRLLEALAKEVVIRLTDMAQTQLLLVTQALGQGLPGEHEALHELLKHWTDVVNSTSFSVQTRLNSEQLAKLATALAPAFGHLESTKRHQAVRKRFMGMVGQKLIDTAPQVSELAREALAEQLDFDGPYRGYQLRPKLRGAMLRPLGGKRERSRSPGTPGAHPAPCQNKKSRNKIRRTRGK